MVSPKKSGIFSVKIIRNQDVFVLKNKAKGDIFEVKGISKQFCENKESNCDPAELNTINQSNNKSR